MKFCKLFLFLTIFSLLTSLDGKAQAYMKAQGQQILDKDGKPFIIRSMGIGGWMLQEGYHMNTSGAADTQHELEERIVSLTSKDFKDEFYDLWLANFFNKRDLDSLKSWGFNTIRPALHYKWFTPPIEEEKNPEVITWRNKGFALLDSLIQWCSANKMYLILDLHAAPGGQGYNASISDYDTTKPSLWESEANRNKTVALWKKIADHCKNEPWIGGYDLINETNWTFEGNFDGGIAKNGCQDTANIPLKNLLKRITGAIREVDTNHMIILEGNCWANNYRGLTPPWDDNLVYSFHKYWNENNQAAIQEFLDLREKYDIPIWLGETGENSNTWFTDCVSLMEEHQIGWSWWTHKQLNDIDDPLIILQNKYYKKTLAYWKGNGPKPTREETEKAFLQLAEDAKLENCTYHKDVIDALFRRTNTTESIPFKEHQIPGRIKAADYDLGHLHHAWYDSVYQNLDMNTTPNLGHSCRNDGVDIGRDEKSGELFVGWIESGEWLQYTIDVPEPGKYIFSFKTTTDKESGALQILVNQDEKVKKLKLEKSKTVNDPVITSSEGIELEKGYQQIKILFREGGFRFYSFDLKKL